MKLGLTVGGYIAGIVYIWIAFYLGSELLPDGWMVKWYGFPVYITLFAGMPAFVILGMYLGDRCTGDEGKP